MEKLWLFFAEYWDDHITLGGPDRVCINARTMRVLESLYGKTAVREQLESWSQKNEIRLLGDTDELTADAPCVELLGYVSNIPGAARSNE